MDVMESRGSQELSLFCESVPDLEASQRDLDIGSAGITLGVVAFIGVAGECLRSID